ncbi:MAG: Ldh family oxidoreductase [Pigmentiphaga sp.]|uniref:Ldh family oxidoreductase n=1 Tax=Pigmentiphaga sp. TaxID=1977564 RepID=UPI0029B045EF|nr:Ldh family oxidoreductase [Pigmentiphaga sp.]MDX3905582.1 Ldh family oxidoreductase [Pigmentiphaga sp.]
MTTTSAGAASGPLDPDRPDGVRMSVEEATSLGKRALGRLGFPDDEAAIIVDQLIDNALCGYRFASLPRILAIAGDEKSRRARRPIEIVHDTPASALLDGGNNVGYVAVYRAAEIAIEKAKKNGIASVGVYDSYYSGRNAYYVEKVTREGLFCLHIASAKPRVLPIGGARPALGTNPLCFGFPSVDGPVVFDMGTASLMWGELLLHAHLGKPIPDGIGFDADGNPSTDANKVIEGGVVPFGDHRGYGLAFAVQAMGLLAGAAIPRGQAQDYGFLFIAMDPKLMLPGGDFERQMSDLVRGIKATKRRPGVDEIRIPSERAFRERERRRTEGLVFDRAVVESLEAL